MARDELYYLACTEHLDASYRIVARGAPIGANRARAVISKIFSWAVKRNLVENNPCAGVERPSPENQRDRALTADEIRKLWAVLDEEAWCCPARRDRRHDRPHQGEAWRYRGGQ